MRVMPHTSLKMNRAEDFDLLSWPGGRQWKEGDNLEISPATGYHPVKTDCGYLRCNAGPGDLGLLDEIPLPANFPGCFKALCPGLYREHFFIRPCPVSIPVMSLPQKRVAL